MSTALAVQAKQELQALLAADPTALDMVGGENLTAEDLNIFPARIKIAHQDDSDTGAKAGEFFNASTGEVYGDSIEFAMLFPMKPTRVEYFTPYTKDTPPHCASDDGENPRESTDRRPLQTRKPGPCETCPQASWKDENGVDRRSPLCSRQRNFMIAVKSPKSGWDKGSLMLQKSRVKSADVLTDLMIRAGLRKSLVCASKFVEGDSGDFYVTVFGIGGKLTTPDIVELFEVRAGSKTLYDSGKMVVLADEGDQGSNGSTPITHAPVGEHPDDGPPLDFLDDAPPAVEPAQEVKLPQF